MNRLLDWLLLKLDRFDERLQWFRYWVLCKRYPVVEVKDDKVNEEFVRAYGPLIGRVYKDADSKLKSRLGA